MVTRYIRVNPVVDLFAPVIRGTGNIAVVGAATAGTPNAAQAFTTGAAALAAFPGDLGQAIAMTFQQTPGPPLVYGVRAAGTDFVAALDIVSTLDVQIVVIANTALNGTTGDPATVPPGAIAQLSNHVTSISNTGGDGQERIGVAMLAKGVTDTAPITGTLANERMVYIAHKSDQDAAAAVAGTIAGYAPHISLLLKQVNITSDVFSPTEIAAINGTETFDSGPAGKGVNWLAEPTLIPGKGIYMGEGYTGNPGGKKFIDVVRTIDDVSFRLKARLIKSIGTLRVSRAGLRGLVSLMEAELKPLVRNEVIESFQVIIPILLLLDKDPNSLSDDELQQIHNAQAERVVEVVTVVEYAGAIHRLAITLKFV